jgi:hypothetical protein
MLGRHPLATSHSATEQLINLRRRKWPPRRDPQHIEKVESSISASGHETFAALFQITRLGLLAVISDKLFR